MNFIFALVAAGFMTGHGPIAEFISAHKTEQECVAAKAELDKTAWAPTVEAGGTACVKVTIVPGKPV